jgi:hypothetical protein
MFKALTRLFGNKPKPPRLSLPVAGAATAAQARHAPEAFPFPMAPAPTSTPTELPPPPAAAALPARNATPEELCGITSGMTADEIRARLAQLYQRHNRAASSFDPELREEAEQMLETVAGLRDKYFGSPVPP